eukprot:TRINITY_DN33615_c0_g1_i1.p1 TRINITY_DN33615_c0_g1~~TRINITY_DN33615_c0_g1_i1.p1  ORF type:complete len:971 (+),score=191.06 TRINITY_DN33615_c0_g1_i1:179-2914(+)
MKGRSAMVPCAVGDVLKKMSKYERAWKVLSKCVKEMKHDSDNSDDDDQITAAKQQQALNTFHLGDIIRKSNIKRKFINDNSDIKTTGNQTTWRGLTSSLFYQSAADIFTEIIEEDINDRDTSNAKYGLSVAQHNIGSALSEVNPPQALKSFLLAVSANPTQFESYTNAAQILASQQKYTEAYILHKKALIGLSKDQTKDAKQCARQFLDFLFKDEVKNCTGLLAAKSQISKIESAKSLLTERRHRFQIAFCQLSKNVQTKKAIATIWDIADNDEGGDEAYNIATQLLDVPIVSKRDVVIPLYHRSLSAQNCYQNTPPNPESCSYSFNNLGVAYEKSGQFIEAEQSYLSSLRLRPGFPKAATNLASIEKQTGNHPETETNLLSVIEQNPSFGEAYNNLAVLYSDGGQLSKSLYYYKHAVRLLGTEESILNHAHAAKQLCDWSGYFERVRLLTNRLKEKNKNNQNNHRENIRILHLLSYPFIEEGLIVKIATQRSKGYLLPSSTDFVGEVERLFSQPSDDNNAIGIISSDMKHHPVGCSLTSLLVDAVSNFTCFSTNLQQPDDITDLLQTGCHSFIETSSFSSRTSSDYGLIKALKDINERLPTVVIDVNGNTQGAVELFFAAIKKSKVPHKPATVGFLGYPQSSYGIHDYIVSDMNVLPPPHISQVSEHVIYLSPTYMGGGGISEVIHADDSPDLESSSVTDIIELKSKGTIILCYTGQPYKITPEIFDVWMNVLESTNSVLVISKWNDGAADDNLLLEARSRGIDRIVFVPYFEKGQYRETHKLMCSLVVDSPTVYGGHISTLDAVVSHIPVITMMGSTIRTRATASIMLSLGLSSLVATTLREYEEIAVRHISNPALINMASDVIRASHEEGTKLFNTSQYKQSFDRSFTIVRKLHLLGIKRHVVPDDGK